ncbi:MAG: hypothetical protein A2Z99_21165 [Treponema sp. GWB1_62_6]|nr:MAG: hypothetical protein A2Y36_08080 [Treponema sp. GWA1_62_8]OHE68357.1 MAG: hypothetical protein A2001_06155 [Treponema sp. GWC1_61_84]OHE71705.1 MAG: hypothetical protein A2Z99_21165 [Treponema sp. GWB1_62_6]OHE75098.1 MAG: hypothetical protein A2413_05750 [Treponema sp. RIFOXYC1_FULL_61_9]HCM28759.1 NAD(P)H dehydrogenase [Treponema sp.]
MKITVLGGSPKGEMSVTMAYVSYLKKRYPEHEWSVEQVASRIALLEKNEEILAGVLGSVRESELVLWAFPLYILTVCSQYKRFIELVASRGGVSAFRGKYAASLSTSIHFFDHTAHAYIREVSEDWGMRFTASFSPAMNDLMKSAERLRLDAFAEEVFFVVGSSQPCPRRSAPLRVETSRISPATALPRLPPPRQHPASPSLRAAVLVDYGDSGAGFMADRAALSLGTSVDRIDLETLGLPGHGCLGCLRCGAGECAYEGKDAYIEAYRNQVGPADILVFACTIRDRYLSARWKAFLDRSFFNTHRRTLKGKRIVILASGPLSQLPTLRETLSAYFDWQGAQLVELVSDEAGSPEELGNLIDAAVSRAMRAAHEARQYATGATVPPAGFLGVGGMKIFRDEIYGGLKIVFKADHREYRKTGEYDFPLRNPLAGLGVWLGYWITSIPFIQRGMRNGMTKFMVKPYEAVLLKTAPKSADRG